MRCLLVLSLTGALLAGGCRSTKEPRTVQAKPRPEAKVEVTRTKPAARPVQAVRGRVVSVRDDLRFLIADFAGGKLPALDQQLTVYRLDQKVAEVKISGPFRGSTAAGDITAGDAKPGDWVRDR